MNGSLVIAKMAGIESTAQMIVEDVLAQSGNDPMRAEIEAYGQFLERVSAPAAKA